MKRKVCFKKKSYLWAKFLLLFAISLWNIKAHCIADASLLHMGVELETYGLTSGTAWEIVQGPTLAMAGGQ